MASKSELRIKFYTRINKRENWHSRCANCEESFSMVKYAWYVDVMMHHPEMNPFHSFGPFCEACKDLIDESNFDIKHT